MSRVQEQKAAMSNMAKLGTRTFQTVLACKESLSNCSIKCTHAIKKPLENNKLNLLVLYMVFSPINWKINFFKNNSNS